MIAEDLRIPGGVGRVFDGVPMYRMCAGCKEEFFGPTGYCDVCIQLGEAYDERYFDSRIGIAPSKTVENPSLIFQRIGAVILQRLWIVNAALVLFGLLYMGGAVGAAIRAWRGIP